MRLASLLFIAALLPAQNPKLPEPYQSIVELSHGAPPEFAADAILRVVASNKIPARDTRRSLLEQAFRFAAVAKFPVRMHGVKGTLTDTRSGFLSAAYDLKLDALSLQSRTVRDMLPIDAAKARELFTEITRPTLAPLTCYDALTYDVSDYYQDLGAVSQTAFNAQERKKEEHLKFILDYLGQISSPAEIAPAARVIKSAEVSAEQREILWNRLAAILETMQPDGRSFAAALDEISHEMPAALQSSVAKFKEKSAGCPDDVRQGVTLELSQGTVHSGSTPELQKYWQSPQAQQLLRDGLKLRFTSDNKVIPESARTTREWLEQLTDFLAELADWTEDQEKSPADYYHEKSIIYMGLVELIPPGQQRDKMMQAYVDFINAANLQQQSPVEWFMEAYSMLDRVRNTSSGEPAKLLDAYQKSSNPILALYALEEKTFASPIPAWVTNSR